MSAQLHAVKCEPGAEIDSPMGCRGDILGLIRVPARQEW